MIFTNIKESNMCSKFILDVQESKRWIAGTYSVGLSLTIDQDDKFLKSQRNFAQL